MDLDIASLHKISDLPAQSISAAFSHALQLAREFEGATAPNPPVGCVILDEAGRQLAAAAHKKAGTAHAEALAINQCRQQGTFGQIHTIVVTLEPCNHAGRTPACTKAILATPARKIWIGASDENPKVCGQGAKKIAASGVEINFIDQLDDPQVPELARQAHRLIAPFAKLAATGLP